MNRKKWTDGEMEGRRDEEVDLWELEGFRNGKIGRGEMQAEKNDKIDG